MASTGNTLLTKGIPKLADAFVVIVKTEWNAHLVDRLEEGCIKVLNEAGATHTTLSVPGAVELPFAVQRHQKISSQKADAYITLGTVIQGGTPHFEYVCQMVSQGVTQLNLQLPVPVIFGVLTLNNEQEAIDRTGGVHGHKGEEAAITALKMIALNQSLQ
ncbi:6,7-dimethyl-8-ribityllumazine synthase [Arachidicoccus rhizosphaerae]|jgi:6,7-dimethyl-8-ribityllumazine synthase|uniref:6,7-dimethyl-8-ribityllumazine synthase n=1 Tax=Arachidicoccus rhizosphaerae TaxID=551991 RepID=A0A1H3Z5Z2_9BACT|nr:6,7-dimethyl-8-ribityllumazine synthase [Arachidicoccus rhizosphaerae]SEA18791.1 6,7-dimethyl-8-ribityllumazine synthase [Arachidicoccus rhizosphaerae]